MKTSLATCDRCGVGITAVTHRVNCGYCMGCCPGPSEAFYLPKTLCGPVDAAAVAAELTRREDWLLLRHWQRVQARNQPGDEFLRFTGEEARGVHISLCSGVLWRRNGELLSAFTLEHELRCWREPEAGFEELKETRFATVDEIAACPPIREALRAEDRVLHYRNAPLRVIPRAIPAAFFERHWEMLTQEGLAGLLVVRDWQCVQTVRLEG